MAITPEQLEKYWAANPEKLAEAAAANPTAFWPKATAPAPTPTMTTPVDIGNGIMVSESTTSTGAAPFTGTSLMPQTAEELRALQAASGPNGAGIPDVTYSQALADEQMGVVRAKPLAPSDVAWQYAQQMVSNGEENPYSGPPAGSSLMAPAADFETWVQTPEGQEWAKNDPEMQAALKDKMLYGSAEEVVDAVIDTETQPAAKEYTPEQQTNIDYMLKRASEGTATEGMIEYLKQQGLFNQEQANQQQFADGVFDQIDQNGFDSLTPEQQALVWSNYNNDNLTQDQRDKAWSYNPVQQQTDTYEELAKSQGSNKEKMDVINDTWNQWHQMAINDPESFKQWESQNIEDAIRYHARAANKNVNQGDGLTNKEHHERARSLAYQKALDTGMGEDGKRDGKMIAYDYDTFDDVNNEWGPGDWWKLGNESSLPDGLGGMWETIKSDPVGTLGPIAAGVAVSFLVGPLAAQMGISQAAAGAILNGTSALAQGGSVEDVLKEIALGYGVDVGLDALAPYLKNIDTGSIGSGTWGVDEQLDTIKTVIESGGDPTKALGGYAGGELGQIIFENPEVYDTLIDRGWEPVALAEAVREMGKEGISGGDAKDILLGGVKTYVKEDGTLGTVPLPDMPNVSIGEFPGSEVIGDLLEKGEQGLDEVYEFIRDDLPDIQPEWFGDGDMEWTAETPQWLKELVEEAGQYGDEVYEFVRDDMPDIQPEIEIPDVDLPNWEGSESIDIPEIPIPEMPDIDLPNWEGSESIPLPSIGGITRPEFENPLPEFENPLPDIEIPDLPDLPDLPDTNMTSITNSILGGGSGGPLSMFDNFKTRDLVQLPAIKPQGMMKR